METTDLWPGLGKQAIISEGKETVSSPIFNTNRVISYLTLHDVLYVSNAKLNVNIISILNLCLNNYKVVFVKNKCIIFENGRNEVGLGTLDHNGHYQLLLEDSNAIKPKVYATAMDLNDSMEVDDLKVEDLMKVNYGEKDLEYFDDVHGLKIDHSTELSKEMPESVSSTGNVTNENQSVIENNESRLSDQREDHRDIQFEEFWKYHSQLGHIGKQKIRASIQSANLPGIKIPQTTKCEVCIRGKLKLKSFKHEKEDRATELLERILSDV